MEELLEKTIPHQAIFEQELARLNDRQREAVEAIDGPVMVIAGPGTGKTQILAARIGNILTQTDTRPDNILCLTYTDAGAIAMRKRLFKFIGPDAYKVEISTFHAFCNKVIKENMDAFGIRALDSITELEQVELFRLLIDSFGAKHPLKRWTGEVYYETYRLKKLFQLMKTEGFTPEFIAEKAAEYLTDLPEREEYIYKRGNATKGIKVGDVKQDKIDQEARCMEQLVAAANEYPKFQAMMAERKRYDFDDMILLVLQKFRTDPDLLLNYQEKYQYFLVDEYQDTNGSQNAVLQMLVNYWDEPNVFVVGDDDQSIFRFQGASIENIKSFTQAYPTTQVIVLEDNYRSSQNILDISKQLIEENKERLINEMEGLTKNLTARNAAFAASGIKPQLRQYFNNAHETVGIAKEIEALHVAGVNLNEVAVIYRNHRQADDIVRYLENKKVPLNIKRRADILKSPFILNILKILEYIDGEARTPFAREDLLFELLHLDFFRIDPLAIARMAVDLRHKISDSKRNTWREEIRKAGGKIEHSLFSPKAANDNYANIKQLSDNIEYWIGQLPNTTLQVLVEKIITRGGILRHVMGSPNKFGLMEELQSFFDFIKEESVRDPKFNLSGLLKEVTLMRENELILPIEKIVYAEPGVNFLTAHGSKGLEFQYVFILGCNSKDWDRNGNSGTYKLPDTLSFKSKVSDGEELRRIEESRRLFYVALTRAKQHLVISHASSDINGKQQEQSRFVAEISDNLHLETQVIHLPSEEMLEYNMIVMGEEELPVAKLLEQNYQRRLLENYSLSVSHLNQYLKCPVSFYFSNLLKVPTAKNQYMAFGNAVHFALESLFNKMIKEGSGNFPDAKVTINDFEWHMKRHEDSFTAEEFKRRLEYGREIIPAYYSKYLAGWNKVVTVERNFRTVIDGVSVNGKLDKLEFNGRHVNVVDYKTGKFENAKKKFGPPVAQFGADTEGLTFEQKHGGDYWRQAVFYKILVENEPGKDWVVDSTEFDFIEPDPKSKEYIKQKVVISDMDIAIVHDQIAETYRNIMDLKFDKGCNDKDCKWCAFTKNHYVMLGDSEEDAVIG